MTRRRIQGCLLLLLAGLTAPTAAQEPPRLQAVYPPAGKAGSTVEVVLRGGLAGAQDLLLVGGGVEGELARPAGKVDDDAKKLFESKCATCHELRSPDNRQMSPAQWEGTVDRMIRDRGADIKPDERERIVEFLRSAAAAGLVTATVKIAPDAPPGERELRVVTANGVSTAYPFYVTDLDERLEMEPNSAFDEAREIALPAALSGVCDPVRDRDFLKFEAREGQRLVAKAEAYALNQETQNYFDAVLFLYDADKRPVARSLGFETLDPLIDFTVPKTGTYYLEIRDLLYRGGPGNVYRVQIGELGYKQSIYPLGGQRGERLETIIVSANQPAREWKTTLARTLDLGVQRLPTPLGLFPFHVSDYPDAFDRERGSDSDYVRVTPPVVINGWIGQPGEKDRYVVEIDPAMVRLLQPWAVVGPFESDEQGLDTEYGPERDVLRGQFNQQQVYPTKEAASGWEMQTFGDNGRVDLPGGQNEVWYALHAFEMPREASGLLSLGTDDGCKVWVNGELVHVARVSRPVVPASELVPVQLRRGVNTVLLKVFNVSGPGGFTASASAARFEAFARRLDSPLRPRLRLGFGSGWLTGEVSNNVAGGDARIDWSFARPGEYGLQIDDATEDGGELHAYRLEIAPAMPSFGLRAFPANPSVPRGGRVPVIVERTALNGYRGDLIVRAEGLPDGVTAEPAMLPADIDSAVLVLEASDQAQPGHAPLRIIGQAPGPDGPVQVLARPVDHFRIQNNQIPIERRSMVAGIVARPAPYRIKAEPAVVTARPGQSVDVRISVERADGFGGDITVLARNLPKHTQANTAVLRGGRTDATLQVTFRDQLRRDPFGSSLADDAYRFVIVGLSGGDGLTGGLMYCSDPIVVQPLKPGDVEEPEPEPAAPGHPGRDIWSRKCSSCHQLYDPARTRKTPAAWANTVDRMISERNAPISSRERDLIVDYLQSVAREQ